MTGKKQVKSLTIQPEAVDPEDVEMLQDLLISAVNEAVRQVEEDSEKRLGALTSGMDLSSMGGLGALGGLL